MTGLDLVEAGWKPTVANYLGRVTKARILEAVREGVGEQAVELIGHLKKGEMATEAERLLSGSGWLPEPLRMEGAEATDDVGAGDGSEIDALPDFLSGDGEDDDELEEEEQEPPHSIAAE